MGSADGLRSTITEDEFRGFRIVIPTPRNLLVVLFLLLWLCGWAAGEWGVASSMFLGRHWSIFGVVWLAFWTISRPPLCATFMTPGPGRWDQDTPFVAGR